MAEPAAGGLAGRVRALASGARLSPGAWLGAAGLGLFFLVAVFGPLLAPHSATAQDLTNTLAPPGPGHLLGTDENGIDVLSALLHGARLAFVMSAITVGLCVAIGVTLGALAGYRGGAIDEVIMRVVDVLLAFPGLLLNLAIVAVVDRPSMWIVIFALTLNGWVSYARVARGQVLSLREREYVVAARAMGASSGRVLFRHILPNLLSPLIVQMTFGFGTVILVETSLSFLGLGPQVSYSWGTMLDQGRSLAWKTPRLALAPGLAVAFVVFACNLLGDGLRDRFDPRRQTRRR